jgi:16S rRNA (guanine527-N7)-methyltransferase
MHDVPPDDIARIVDAARSRHPALPADALGRYLAEVLRWNPRAGLIARQNPQHILERLVKESADLLTFVCGHVGEGETGRRVVDVGTGGGFPGVVWALMRPGWEFLLVERRRKKATFLERVVRQLSLPGVTVYAGEASEAMVGSAGSAGFDVAVTMAVGPPDRTARLVEGFLRPGGVFATTLPRRAVSPPEHVARAMTLREASPHGDAVFAIYALDR